MPRRHIHRSSNGVGNGPGHGDGSAEAAPEGRSEQARQPHGKRLLALALAATGVVYGDIGTSPLYTWNEIRHHGGLDDREAVLGAAGLVFWTLLIVVTLKYIVFVLRADNDGEGGTFALMGLLQGQKGRTMAGIGVLLVFAAALVYADGFLTPAISVISAIEGLQVAEPDFARYVVPLTLAVLTALFAVQRVGTGRVGNVFGVVTILWFLVLAALGLWQIVQAPGILAALDPRHALRYLVAHPPHHVLLVLGSVVLCITGGEALYADLGHFGARAIRVAWISLVYPALVLNYLGQGAMLLRGGEIRADNVFYSLVPPVLVIPLVVLATAATIIASQALISGAFSLTRAAVNLGLFPRVPIIHTSEQVEGQIYLPAINWALWFGSCSLVVAFGSSSNMAAAYGLSVLGGMLVTTIATGFVASRVWGWKLPGTIALFGFFAAVELLYLVANSLKFTEGGWVSLMIGIAIFIVMTTWRACRKQLGAAYRAVERSTMAELLEQKRELVQLPRAMVFMTSERLDSLDDRVPVLLMKFIQRYGALPKHLTLFTILNEDELPAWKGRRYEVQNFGEGVVVVRMHLGYMEHPDVRGALRILKAGKLIKLHATKWTVVMGKEELLIGRGPLLWRLRLLLFVGLMKISTQADVYFGLGVDAGVSKEAVRITVSKKEGMEVARSIQGAA